MHRTASHLTAKQGTAKQRNAAHKDKKMTWIAVEEELNLINLDNIKIIKIRCDRCDEKSFNIRMVLDGESYPLMAEVKESLTTQTMEKIFEKIKDEIQHNENVMKI